MAFTTINKSSLHFSPTLYVGNGSTKTVTGVPFEPDMTWIKNRSGATDNEIYDKLRGVGYRIYTNTSAGQDNLGSQGLSAWTSDGFTVGNNGALNGNGNNQVSWNWKANGAGSANTDGSITSTVSVNTTSGFSIVSYTGTGIGSGTATVGHGLGAVPSVVIQKRTGGAANWGMYHKSIGNTASIALNSTDVPNSQADFWGNTTPTSSLVTIGPNFAISGGNILYCFAEKQGYSKFGSYTGNGNADGPFIYTGFKPAFVMIKNSSATESWYILDTKRPGYNTNNYYLNPNTTSAEGTSTTLANTLCSNGFKINNADTSMNTSSQTYIYMAFAEAPLVGSNNVPANAR